MNALDITRDLFSYRAQTLHRGRWLIGTRKRTSYITIHWNGPAIPESRRAGHAGVLDQLRIDTEWQTRRGWANVPSGADGIQYHYAISADGLIYHCRDESAMLWHCGHAIGNRESLSIHLLVGRGQAIPDIQWRSTVALVEQLRARYDVPLEHVLGHNAWRATDCPGPAAIARLADYRNPPPSPPSAAPDDVTRYVIGNADWAGEWRATVREGPARSYPIAGTMRVGAELWIDVLKPDELGETIAGESRWAHMARIADQQADLGFIHMSQLIEAAYDPIDD